MNDAVFLLVSQYGVAVLFVSTFLSCLALPIPASVIMLAGGAFVASGDLGLWATAAAAFLGAVAGDQAGYRLGQAGGAGLIDRLAARPKRAALVARARGFVDRWGGLGVFLSRWLLSPLGPYVNFLGGAARLDMRRFLAWGMAGEAVWVTVYVGLGYGFSSNIAGIADILGNAVVFLACAAVALLLGRLLLANGRTQP
ncbi:DedA family protein [Rhodovulum sp. YNF3179]|uniref:DedA family protein n=1 Tax=Rhodovulum sp. YNF3179 TaxID=3425127 RepID=UPI003D333B6B